MARFFLKRWFPAALLTLIGIGLSIGAQVPAESLTGWIDWLRPTWITGIVLFLMSYSLDSRQLAASMRAPRPVLWATVVNIGLIPLLGWGLTIVQTSPDFSIGLMIAASVPCTMAAASVWTRRAGGNDAVSLLVTALTNGSCFLFTPFWLNLTYGGNVQLDVVAMMMRLVMAVMIPATFGQLIRLLPGQADFATRHKTAIGVLAQGCILVLVFKASCGAGTRLGDVAFVQQIGGLCLVWVSCIILHLAAMAVGLAGARRFGFSRADQTAVAFSGSQKTLPIGVLLATDPKMFGNPDLLGAGLGVPFAVFPMLMYHASQLVVDTFIADRMVAKTPKDLEQAGPSNETQDPATTVEPAPPSTS
jgi:sodium/bile acid cotransporter 7